MSSLSIVAEEHSGVTLLTLSGPLDSNTSAAFNQQIITLIQAGKCNVVVDLAQMSMLTSAGIGELAGAFNDLEEHGGELRLAAIPDQAARALEQLALLDMFEVFPNAQAALFKA